MPDETILPTTGKSLAGKPEVPLKQIRKVVYASSIGNAMEAYDFIIYGLSAALVFNKVFFPNLSPVLGTFVSFASFAVAFLLRPIGAIVLGHFGDKYGRRTVLIYTVGGMGVATGLMGLIPSASTIGAAAPAILIFLRAVQGFSLGGEWGGATTLVLEHAPPEKRSRLQVFVQLGSPVGSLAATASLSALGGLSKEQMVNWGWRIPFLASFLVVAVALYLRVAVKESPIFEAAQREQRLAKVPAMRMLRTAWIPVIAGTLIVLQDVGGYYIVTTFVTNYATATVGLSRTVVLTAITIGTVVQAIGILWLGFLGDKYKPTKVLFWAMIAPIVAFFPMFALVNTGDPLLATLGISLGVAIVPMQYGVLGLVIAQLFTEDVRYTGLAVAASVGGALAGLTPVVSIATTQATGSSNSVVFVLLGLSALSLAGLAIGGSWLRRGRTQGLGEPTSSS